MSKSHVCLEYKVCIICGQKNSKGVFLHKGLREVLPQEGIVTGPEVCKSCTPEPGHVLLIEATKINSTVVPMEGGQYAVLPDESYTRLFDVPVPDKRIALTSSDVFKIINEIARFPVTEKPS